MIKQAFPASTDPFTKISLKRHFGARNEDPMTPSKMYVV